MGIFKTIFTLLFIINVFSLSGQQDIKEKSKLKTLKLYANAFYAYNENDDYKGSLPSNVKYLYEQEKYGFGALSFAIDIQGKNNLSNEFELMPIDIQIIDDNVTFNFGDTIPQAMGGSKITSIESYFRYQLNYCFTKKGIIKPYIGFSSKVYYDFLRDNPNVSTKFMRTNQNIGLNFAIIPSISIKLSEKFAIDFNMPISIYDIKLNVDNYVNPIIPYDDQKTNKIISQMFPKKLNFRIGLTYTI